MASAISNSLVNWCQFAILDPPNEGVARINRCFRGVDLHQIDHPTLDWTKRVIDLITGVILLVPILNTIFWMFIRTIGNAQILSQPISKTNFNEWEDAIDAAADPILDELAPLAPLEGQLPSKVKEYKCIDKTKDHPVPYEANWRIESYADIHVVTRNCIHNSSKSVYNTDWKLQSLEFTDPIKDIQIQLVRNKNTIAVTGSKEGNPVSYNFVLENDQTPWIQQSMGFKPFVLSTANDMKFFAIRPDDISLTEFCVTKTDRDPLPPYGKAVKLETRFNNFLLNSVFGCFASAWFNPVTGDEYASEYNVYLFTWGESKSIK
jgi:hypothetical protein